MAKKSMSYDHAAYIAPQVATVSALAGNANLTGKYVAFTDMLLKSATIVVVVAGTTTGAATAATGYTFNAITNSGTTTTSVGYVQFGSAAAYVTSTNITLGNTALTETDMIEVKGGADIVIAAEIAYELVVNPGADVTD